MSTHFPPPPRLFAGGLPRGLVWRLLPWSGLRRAALLAILALGLAVGWLQLTETDAEALPFTQDRGLPAAAVEETVVANGQSVVHHQQSVPAAEEPVLPPSVPEVPAAIAAGAEMLVPEVELVTGEASYYARMLEGRRTASGEVYRGNRLTAAHRSLPFGTRLRVTNLGNGRSVEVRVNDRGPFHRRRILDLSRTAAERLGMVRRGHARVQVEILPDRG
jgi:rare lipoprotein A